MIKDNILIPQYDNQGNFLRQIRSFVCRRSRITKSQLHAIKNYWPLFGINFQLKKINFSSIFLKNTPLILEIGFGSGKSLVDTAINFPDKNFLGIEVYKSGIGSCLRYAFFSKIKNLKIIYHDVVEVMNYMISNNTLFIVKIFFPDPWNKTRHFKRRLLKYSFLYIILTKLIRGGILHIVTDSASYAYDIKNSINSINNNTNILKKRYLLKTSLFYPITKFEEKRRISGNQVFNLMFQVI